MLPTLRVKRMRGPWLKTENVSAAPEPLKVIVSMPAWPSTTSLPSPGSQVRPSSPAPRKARSSPPLPSTASLPSPPSSVSARGAARQRVVLGAAVGGERERARLQALRGHAVEAGQRVDLKLVAPGLGARERERDGDADHAGAAVGAGHVDRVVELTAVDDDAVGRAVGAAEVARDGLERGARELVGGQRVGAAARADVDLLERAEAHHDAADVADEAHARPVGREPERLVGARAVEGQRVAAVRARDRVVAVTRVPLEAVVAGAEVGAVVAAVAVDDVVAVAGEQPLGAAAAQQRVGAAAARDRDRRPAREGDPDPVVRRRPRARGSGRTACGRRGSRPSRRRGRRRGAGGRGRAGRACRPRRCP